VQGETLLVVETNGFAYKEALTGIGAGLIKRLTYRLSPAYTVSNDFLNIGVVEGTAGLVTGLEVEYLTNAARPCTACTEDVTVLKPCTEYKIIRLGNEEGLGIKLVCLKLECLGKTLCDRMCRIEIPDNLLNVVTPLKVTGTTEKLTEGLGVMCGVETDKAHTLAVYAANYLVNELVLYLSVEAVTPPKKNIGIVKNLIGKTLIGIVKTADANIHVVIFIKKILYSCMDTVGIALICLALCVSLMAVFMPYCYSDLISHFFFSSGKRFIDFIIS